MRTVAVFAQNTREGCFPPAAWTRMEKLAKSLGEFHWIPWNRANPGESFASRSKKIGGADILITGWGCPFLTPEDLDANPNLKLIAHSAGSVAFVDISAWKRSITVTNVMPNMGYAVAEFTVCLMLNGLRRFNAFIDPKLVGTIPFYPAGKGGRALRFKRVGLIGLGIIARQVINLLKPFDCEIVVSDPFVPESVMASLGVKKVELDELMQTSDVVSLHAPGTEALKNLLDERRLRMLKPDSILVNTARGIIIDHDALARVAAEGKIMAYLDVTHPEPLPDDHPLHKLPNVTILGHVAGPTPDERLLLGDECLDEVERFLKKQPLKNAVTEAQYANQSRT